MIKLNIPNEAYASLGPEFDPDAPGLRLIVAVELERLAAILPGAWIDTDYAKGRQDAQTFLKNRALDLREGR
jgi:hypothetical protein